MNQDSPRHDKTLAKIENSQDFTLQTEFITLVALLKAAGLTSSGGQAKCWVAEGLVWVDEAIELRKTCKIRGGQKVQVGASEIKVHAISRVPPDLSLCARPPEGDEKTWERPGVFSREVL
jgi:ribosome-associated protein